VEVNYVESGEILKDQLHHVNVMRQRLTALIVSPERSIADWDKSGIGSGVSTGKQRYFMAQRNQLLGEP